MNQKDLIKYGLLALGAYLIYKYVQENGGISNLFGASTTTVPGTGIVTHPAAVTAGAGTGTSTGAATGTGAGTPPAGPTAPHPGGWLPTDYDPCVGGTAVWNSGADHDSAEYRSTPQSAALVKCVMPTAAAPTQTISQKMLAAAGTNSLNMDQWDFYYEQVTGTPISIDPGSIDPGVYAGAGIVDRTTPTDIGTWLAIMQNQAPQLGLSGLGRVRYEYTPAWLM